VQIDPFILAALSAAPSPLPANVADIEVQSLRASYEAAGRLARKSYPTHLEVTEHQVRSHGRECAVRVYRPQANGPLPGVLFLHGGGWVIGSIESHDGIAAELALGANAVVASVGYALAPEAPYPAPIEDVEAAAAWLTAHAASLGIDPRRLAISGDSAGGHLATLYGVRAAMDQRPSPFLCQLLFYPAVDSAAMTDSYRDNARAPVLSAALMRWFIEAYAGPDQRADPRAFPMRAATLAGQPEAYIVVAGHDPLRDEALQYACRLAADGVIVTARHAADLVHGFLRLRAVAPRAQAEFDLACAWLARTLREPVPVGARTETLS
jgi:acetyl esterase